MCRSPRGDGARQRGDPPSGQEGERTSGTRKLGRESASVPVIEPADLRVGDVPPLRRFNRPGVRAVVIQRAMCSRSVVVGRVAQGERVAITRYGEAQAVLVPVTDFLELVRERPAGLHDLEQALDRRFAAMQTERQRKGLASVFAMTGEELGRVARPER